jgi:integrin beta 3
LGILVVACLVVLAALPLYFGISAAVRDPVFDSLDELAVPGWAATDPVDGVSGSRWCLMECRLRERTATSERGVEETTQVYRQAMGGDGWQSWKAALCPERPVEGHYSCWRRDELTLDLWVRARTCAAPPSPGPAARPSGPDEPSPDSDEAGQCAGALVTIKVRNAIDDDRLGPQPSTDPSLTGEDPDPVFTDDPLEDPTPLPS